MKDDANGCEKRSAPLKREPPAFMPFGAEGGRGGGVWHKALVVGEVGGGGGYSGVPGSLADPTSHDIRTMFLRDEKK